MDNVALQQEKEQHRYSEWKRNNNWKSGWEKEWEKKERTTDKREIFFPLSIQWKEHDGKMVWRSRGYYIKAEVLRQRSFLAPHTDVSLALFDFYWCVRFPFTPGNAIRLPFLLLCLHLRLQTFLLNFAAHKGQACNITRFLQWCWSGWSFVWVYTFRGCWLYLCHTTIVYWKEAGVLLIHAWYDNYHFNAIQCDFFKAFNDDRPFSLI